MENTVRLLMTETSPEVCSTCRDQLPAHNIEVGVCPCNGEAAYAEIINQKPDAVLLDVFMPNMDALSVKRRYDDEHPDTDTIFYATGAFQNDEIQREMMENGFAFYFMKPFNVGDLGARIATKHTTRKASPESGLDVHNEGLVTDMLRDIGIPAHIKGYQFLRVAILMVVDDPTMIGSVTKAIYPGIAQMYDTTVPRVERAIRHAIEVAWNRGDIEVLGQYFGNTIHRLRGKPTNSEFIAMLADRVTLTRHC